MIRPPIDLRYRSTSRQHGQQSLLVSYAMVLAVPLLLWVIADPLPRTVFLTAFASLVIGTRRAYRLLRCFHDCGGFVLDLGDTARITVRHLPNK